jgi:hypothetical protein
MGGHRWCVYVAAEGLESLRWLQMAFWPSHHAFYVGDGPHFLADKEELLEEETHVVPT